MNEYNEYEDEYANEIIDTETKENTIFEKTAPDTTEILQQLSDTLHLLDKQLTVLSENISNLPAQTRTINTAAENLHTVADELSKQIHDDCLAEYKKIIENAAKNYKQLQRATDSWQKSLADEREQTLKVIKFSAIITPLLLLFLIITTLL